MQRIIVFRNAKAADKRAVYGKLAHHGGVFSVGLANVYKNSLFKVANSLAATVHIASMLSGEVKVANVTSSKICILVILVQQQIARLISFGVHKALINGWQSYSVLVMQTVMIIL